MRIVSLSFLLFALAIAGVARAQGVDPAVMEACRRGTPDSRIEACGKIVAATPAAPKEALATARDQRCEAYRLKGTATVDLALADCAEAIKLEPTNWRHYWLRGLAEEMKNQWQAALADFSSAASSGANAADLDPGVSFHRALSFLRLRRFDESIAEFGNYLRIRPTDANAYRERGLAYARKGMDDEAIADYTAGLAIMPKGVVLLYNRALAYVRQHDDAKAMADLDAAIVAEPNYGFAHIARGAALLRAGDAARAVEDYQVALSTMPTSLDAQRGLSDARRQVAAAAKPGATQQAARTQASAPKTSNPAPAATGNKRVALVIGNSAYKFANPLPNPANDAADIAKALRGIGFTVIEGHDLDWRGMVAKAREFSSQLDGAGVALLFYAGHGVQVDGKNYLIPIDAKLDKAGDLDLDAVDLQTVLRPMEQEKRVNLVFLDACRDNPFTRSLSRSLGATRSASVARGLAEVSSAAGTMIAFSTQPDNVAQDGTGRNSPFTNALLKYIARPNLEVEQMMKMVRVDVMAATQEKQVPWGHSSLVGDVYLNPKSN